MKPVISEAIILMAEALSDFYGVCYVTEIEYVEVEGRPAVNLHFEAVEISIAKSKVKEGRIYSKIPPQ